MAESTKTVVSETSSGIVKSRNGKYPHSFGLNWFADGEASLAATLLTGRSGVKLPMKMFGAIPSTSRGTWRGFEVIITTICQHGLCDRCEGYGINFAFSLCCRGIWDETKAFLNDRIVTWNKGLWPSRNHARADSKAREISGVGLH